MSEATLNIRAEENINSEAIAQIESGLAPLGKEAKLHIVPTPGPQASILLLAFSSIVVVFSTAFFAKLGHKTAEDVYPHIKEALSTVYAKYFGKNPAIKKEIIVSQNAQHKASETKYSLVLSLYCVGPNNENVKFLYEQDCTREQFDAATEAYVHLIKEFTESGTGPIAELIEQSDTQEQTWLVARDSDTEAIELVDWKKKI